MIIYLNDPTEYTKDKCIFCLKPIKQIHKIIIQFGCFGYNNFVIPTDQTYYGYCSTNCGALLTKEEKIDLVQKNTGWIKK